MQDTRRCCRCKEFKTHENFYPKGNGLQSLCKKCLCSAQIDRWIKRKLKAIELLGGQCAHCGYRKNYAALDFHHGDESQKEWDWTKMRLRKWDDVVQELGKCVLLCKNCHYELHNPQAELAVAENLP